jgi:hypothetical protein
MANLRLRELERIFTARYGDTLPYDDAEMQDLIIVAHHIAHLGGEIEKHIVAWVSLWLPEMPLHEAKRLARKGSSGTDSIRARTGRGFDFGAMKRTARGNEASAAGHRHSPIIATATALAWLSLHQVQRRAQRK